MRTSARRIPDSGSVLGIGLYRISEAAQLVGLPVARARRWVSGYRYATKAGPVRAAQLVPTKFEDELSFADLVELRFVEAFVKAGVPLATVRACLAKAREVIGTDHPFSTRRFKTDGSTILFAADDNRMLDLKYEQYVLAEILRQTFVEYDMEGDEIVRWRPYRSRASILIDPGRAFGQPIAAESGTPTSVLYDSVQSEGALDVTSALYDVPIAVLEDVMEFEKALRGREGSLRS